MKTLEAFSEAAKRRPKAGRSWLSRLKALSDRRMGAIIEEVPQEIMSESARAFAGQILTLNRRRVLDEGGKIG